MTDIATLPPVERIARVIVAEALSPNAEDRGGSDRAISDQVDSEWRGEVGRAIAVLRTLREPTPEMVEAGKEAGDDPAEIWNAMVRAAIDSHIALIGA